MVGARWAAALVAMTLLASGGCGDGSAGKRTGTPHDVVGAAPDRTLAAGTARLSVTSQDAFVEGTVDLATGRAQARLRSRGVPDRAGLPIELDYLGAYLDGSPATAEPLAASAAPPQLVAGGIQPGNPVAVLDLLRGVVEVKQFGGTAVRGAATFRYEVVIDVDIVVARVPEDRRPSVAAAVRAAMAPQVPADVWVDSEGRVRRVQLGNSLARATTTTDRRGLPLATTIDLFDFGLREPAEGRR